MMILKGGRVPPEGKDIGGAECLAEQPQMIGHLSSQPIIHVPLQLHLITSVLVLDPD